VSYDLNGNIESLTRRGFDNLLDNLTYGYTGNRLDYVHDTGGDPVAGFINGNAGTDDYSYNSNGNLKKDKNKGIVNDGDIKYNFLNLPIEVIKGTEKVRYIYDATGRKLAQELYNSSGTLVKTTDYIGELIFENNTLKMIQHAEGRVMTDGEYQYYLKDHLGNIRVTFTTKALTSTSVSANFETPTNANFLNHTFISTYDLVDHTDAGQTYSKVQWLTGVGNGRVGLAKTYDVMPGDEITASAYCKYMNISSTVNANGLIASLANAFNVSNPQTPEQIKIYNGLNDYAVWVSDGHNGVNTVPKAFVTIVFFDKDYNLIDAAWQQVSEVGAQTSGTVKQPPHDLVTITAKAPEAGYAYVFLSNENPTMVDIYFDDVTFSFLPSPIVDVADYFPFGLRFNEGQRGGVVGQPFLFNGKELQDELNLNWYDYGARMYMPEIGRWGVVDPLAAKAPNLTPYRYSFNNPVNFVDPDGRYEVNIGYGQTMDHRDITGSIDHYGSITLSERDVDIIKQEMTETIIEIGQKWSTHVERTYGEQRQVENVELKFAAWVASTFIAQQAIPGLKIVEFSKDFTDSDNLGINIKLGFNDPKKQFSEFGWIQTVRTNKPQNFPNRPPMGDYEPFNDTPGDGTPYYPMSYSNIEGFSSIMVDHPGRDRDSAYVIWRAEVTIGGIKDGAFVPLGTLTYGFDIHNGELKVIYPHVTQPSPWHVDSFKNKSKW